MKEPQTRFTTGDLARRWNKSTERIRQIARAGQIRPEIVTPGGIRLFTETEAQRYEREHPELVGS